MTKLTENHEKRNVERNQSKRIFKLQSLNLSSNCSRVPWVSSNAMLLSLCNIAGIQTALRYHTVDFALLGEFSTVFTAFFNVHKADSDHSPSTDGEQEWEAHPVISGIVDDRLDDIGADD